MKEVYGLKWPDGWPRTQLQDRATRTAWKKTERQAIELLEDELDRFGAVGILIEKDGNKFRLKP